MIGFLEQFDLVGGRNFNFGTKNVTSLMLFFLIFEIKFLSLDHIYRHFTLSYRSLQHIRYGHLYMWMLINVSSITEVRWHYGMWDTPHSYHGFLHDNRYFPKLFITELGQYDTTRWLPCRPMEIILHAHAIPTVYPHTSISSHPSILCLLFSLASFFITITHAS